MQNDNASDNNDVWDTVVKRWKEAKQEYADAVTELVLAQTKLMEFSSELQTKFSDMQLDSMDDHCSAKQQKIYQTRLHHWLYGDSTQLMSEKEIVQREELKHRGNISALKIRVHYTLQQVEQFFRHDLRSNEVFLLLDRAYYLELQMTIILQDMEQFNNHLQAL